MCSSQYCEYRYPRRLVYRYEYLLSPPRARPVVVAVVVAVLLHRRKSSRCDNKSHINIINNINKTFHEIWIHRHDDLIFAYR
mmetsp:Transcript_103050/g.288728  ORF Transcript_103050/g.288728 Transcript_103050/m.288728 type:complete len:82 (-) Transcript_103050:97-342(-)